VRRNHAQHLRKVGGATGDILHGVGAIADTHGPRGLGGQHHDARSAVGAGSLVAPVRFLVAHRGEQTPVQAVRGGGLLEPGAQFGQARTDVVLETAAPPGTRTTGLGFGIADEPAQQP